MVCSIITQQDRNVMERIKHFIPCLSSSSVQTMNYFNFILDINPGQVKSLATLTQYYEYSMCVQIFLTGPVDGKGKNLEG